MSDHVNIKHSHKVGMQDDKYNKKNHNKDNNVIG